jgi:hypothetical protein
MIFRNISIIIFILFYKNNLIIHLKYSILIFTSIDLGFSACLLSNLLLRWSIDYLDRMVELSSSNNYDWNVGNILLDVYVSRNIIFISFIFFLKFLYFYFINFLYILKYFIYHNFNIYIIKFYQLIYSTLYQFLPKLLGILLILFLD